MLPRFLSAALVLPLAALPFAASAQDLDAAARSYFESEISAWADDAVLVEAIRTQNAQTSTLSAGEIAAMDEEWRAQIGANDRPVIEGVLGNDAAAFLNAQVEAAGGQITEIFVMDAQGLNVAASGVTSDYWQGDEAKHQETFGAGAGAVHVGEVEFDESSQRYQSQISATIVDPDTGEPIGALTVGLDAEALM